MLQEDVIRVSDSKVRKCVHKSTADFEPVLAIVCNIARAHTITHGRVIQEPPLQNFLSLESSRGRLRRGGEVLGGDSRTRYALCERKIVLIVDAFSRRGGRREVEVDAL